MRRQDVPDAGPFSDLSLAQASYFKGRERSLKKVRPYENSSLASVRIVQVLKIEL